MSLLLLAATIGTLVGALGTLIAFTVAGRRARPKTSATVPTEDLFRPSESRRARTRRRRFQALALPVVLIAASLSGWIITRGLSYCGPSVQRQYGDCIGVTDGSYVFDTELATIERQILLENQQVEHSSRPYVTIAFVASMTRQQGQDTLTPLVHELEGAYLAQHTANRNSSPSDPLIKMSLANMGNGEGWKTIVDQLIGKTVSTDHLVAVTGFEQSTEETRSAALTLAAHGIPMVTPDITASSFNNQSIHGFFSVVPDDSAQAAALVAFANAKNPVIVTSTDNNSQYTSSLAQAFQHDLAVRSLADVELYAPAPLEDTRFTQIATDVCAVNADAVFFAGRGTDFAQFVNAMANRICVDHKLTVLTGDDAEWLDHADEIPRLDANMRVVYSALAQPGQWTANVPASQNRSVIAFRAFEEAFTQQSFSPSALDDGLAMTAYDAVLTLSAATRSAEPQLPSTSSVLQMLLGLHGDNSVAGVSGVINLDDETGRPVRKPIPLVQLDPDGRTSTISLVIAP